MTLASYLPITFPIVWGTWGLFWLLAAGWSAPSVERQRPRGRLLHVASLLVGGALFFATSPRLPFLHHSIFRIGIGTAIAGLALTVLGLGFSIWARITLGRMWSAKVTLKAGHMIVEDGPYAFARHPIYTGILTALAGSALARDTVAAYLGLAIILIGLVLKLRQEEHLLLGHFGPSYEEYRGRVKGLIPLLW